MAPPRIPPSAVGSFLGTPLTLAIGTVKIKSGSESDEAAKPGKVYVQLDLQEDKGDQVVIPATLLSPFVGAEYGAYFVPPEGAKVLVGFSYGREDAYVIGFFWNGQQPVPDSLETTGFVIKTKSKQCITFDEKENTITIEDAKSNRICIDTENNSIAIESKGSLSITAENELSLKGQSVVITDSTEVSKLQLTSEKAELVSPAVTAEATGQMVLKGVPINLN
jgi:uncharacterized Zn ribbon protein